MSKFFTSYFINWLLIFFNSSKFTFYYYIIYIPRRNHDTIVSSIPLPRPFELQIDWLIW